MTMTLRNIVLLGAALLGVLAAGQVPAADEVAVQEPATDDTPQAPAVDEAAAPAFVSDETAAQPIADESAAEPVRFSWVDIYLDSGAVPLAAYQFELTAATGDFQIVGVEGGEHPAFREAPYYDPAALMNDRIIIAAFNTGDDLPSGRTRIARIHVQITGDQTPDYVVNLTVAATADGTETPAVATAVPGEGT